MVNQPKLVQIVSSNSRNLYVERFFHFCPFKICEMPVYDVNSTPPKLSAIEESPVKEVKASNKRWYILGLFMMYAALSTFQWVEYSIISNIVTRYYDVSATSVEWTSMSFNIMWPILLFPTSLIMEKMGLRVAGLLGAILTALGAAVKIFSVEQNLFFVVMIGQAVVAISQLFIWSIPPTIAVTWFKSNEISTACSLGVSGILLGSAMGFIIPPILVKNHDGLQDVGEDFKTLCWSLAIACTIIAIVVVMHFPKMPFHPPSQSQLEQRKTKQDVTMSMFLDSTKTLLKNKDFDLHIVSYSLNVGIFSSTGALLNPFVLSYFEGAQEDAGRMGFIMILIGVLGSILTGFVLDKTHRYKETAVFIFAMCAVSMGFFLLALEMRSKWMVYLSISIFGLFINSYFTAGIEFGTELSFPSSECTSTGILMASSQLLSFFLTYALGELNNVYGAFWSIICQICILVAGTILTILTPNNLRRQEAIQIAVK